MSYALIKDGAELARHSTREACAVEAYDRKLVVSCGADFPGDRSGNRLVAGVEIVASVKPMDKADRDYEAMAMRGIDEAVKRMRETVAETAKIKGAYARHRDTVWIRPDPGAWSDQLPPFPANDNHPIDALRDTSTFCYVATPYTDYPLGPAAAAYDAASAAAKLMKRGLCVVSPIAHSHAVATVGRLDAVDHDFWQHQDQPLVDAASACVVVMLEGWATSRGVRHEIGCFEKAGKPIVYVTMEGI